MKKGKKIAAAVAALVMTAAVTAGGTVAYLQSVTETKKNVFTSGKNITTELTETEWNENSGKEYTPGQVIAKNPVMKNDSKGNEAIYTAVRLDYINHEGAKTDYESFKEYASVQSGLADGFNTADWKRIAVNADGSEIWMYQTALAAGHSTNAIFDSVKVHTGITEVWSELTKTTNVYRVDEAGNKTLVQTASETYDPTVQYVDDAGNPVQAGTLPSFEINVTGFAVQASGLSSETAQAELVKLVNSKTDPKFAE